jgi:hypothetical protein
MMQPGSRNRVNDPERLWDRLSVALHCLFKRFLHHNPIKCIHTHTPHTGMHTHESGDINGRAARKSSSRADLSSGPSLTHTSDRHKHHVLLYKQSVCVCVYTRHSKNVDGREWKGCCGILYYGSAYYYYVCASI